jgi:hypothetical protein
MSRAFNDFDGNEGGRLAGRIFFFLMFLEPTMNGAGRATDFSCDLGYGGMGSTDLSNGLLLDFGTVTNAGHEELNVRKSTLQYRQICTVSKDAVPGRVTSNRRGFPFFTAVFKSPGMFQV